MVVHFEFTASQHLAPSACKVRAEEGHSLVENAGSFLGEGALLSAHYSFFPFFQLFCLLFAGKLTVKLTLL